jgi:hypothetical protein
VRGWCIYQAHVLYTSRMVLMAFGWGTRIVPLCVSCGYCAVAHAVAVHHCSQTVQDEFLFVLQLAGSKLDSKN